jgi:hypothetical protein
MNSWIIQERLIYQRHEADLQEAKKAEIVNQAMAYRLATETPKFPDRKPTYGPRLLTRRILTSMVAALLFWIP